MELSEVKKAMTARSPVVYDGRTYQYITACIMRLDGNEWRYSVELLDESGRSVIVAALKDVAVKEDKYEHKRYIQK